MQSEEGTSHTRVREKWINEIWKGKYGLTYAWNFKEEDGMLKTLFSYVRLNFKHEDAEQKVEQVMREYIQTKDELVEKRLHPFSWLVKDRSRYVSRLIPKKVVIQEYKPFEVKKSSNIRLTDQEIVDWITPDPTKFAKGFFGVSGMMRKLNPDLYQRTKAIMLDFLGKDKALLVFEKYEKEEKEKASWAKEWERSHA